MLACMSTLLAGMTTDHTNRQDLESHSCTTARPTSKATQQAATVQEPCCRWWQNQSRLEVFIIILGVTVQGQRASLLTGHGRCLSAILHRQHPF